MVAPHAVADVQSDPLFRAMQDELDRSMSQLSIEEMPPPYFLSYRIHDIESAVVEARYGALVESDRNEESHFYIECRVGDPSFDNSYYVGGWQDLFNMREGMVEEDDYDAIRHQIWLYTDAAYKSALENLAGKDAYLQAHPTKEQVPDFTPAESFVSIAEPVHLDVRLQEWELEVRAAARALGEFESLQDWRVEYRASAENKRYVNSEGSRHLKGARFGVLEIVAMAQADDGQRLTSFLRYMTRGDDKPPRGEELVAHVRDMAEELEAMITAPTLDEYVGPVLFEDFAAAQLISQLFAAQLTPTKTPLVADDWMKSYLPDPKLAGRMNRRIFPENLVVTDEPNRDVWQGVRLAGHTLVDDEGIACQDITLVKEGRLVTLPMSRQPTKKIKESNGHARTFENQWTLSTITNLFVRSEQPAKDLVGRLRELAADFDGDYGLLITRLDDPSVSDRYRWTEFSEESRPLLTSPVGVYKVYAKDGTMEPVRGLEFDEVTIRSLRDVAALGKDARAWNVQQSIDVEGVTYPAAIITPDILIEEMEFTSGAIHEPMPVSGRPVVAR
jgi:TldD protein